MCIKITLKTILIKNALKSINPRRKNDMNRFLSTPRFFLAMVFGCVCKSRVAAGTKDTNNELMINDW